jgi:hypothetical protein
MGRLAEAAPLFDEAMAHATTSELAPMTTGLVYCRTICASLDALDYGRTRGWTDAARRIFG